MKTLKKIIPFVLLLSTATMSGCSMYSSKAAEKSWFVGTYELDVYKARHNMDAEEEPYDRKAEEGIKAYFTLDIDGYGYYGYKDNNTEAWVDSVFSEYIADDEKTELFKAISMNNGSAHAYEWEWKVGCLDEPTMGFQYKEIKQSGIAGVFGKKDMEYTLSYTIPQRHNNIMNKDIRYQYVSYKKISDETGYTKINQLLGTNYQETKPFEFKKATGYWVYRCQTKEGSGLDSKGYYEYAILDCDSFNNNELTVYYSLKSEPGQKTAKVPFSVTTKGHAFKIVFNDKEFNGTGIGCTTDQSTYGEDSQLIDESFSMFYSSDLTIDEIIAQETAPQA